MIYHDEFEEFHDINMPHHHHHHHDHGHHHEVHHKVCQTHGMRGAVSSGSQQPCRKLS